MKWSEVAQSCPTLCDPMDPMDCSLPASSHGIFQARVLERVAISFSRGSSPPRDQTQVSRIVGRRFTVWATKEVLKKVWGLHQFLLFPFSCGCPVFPVPFVAKLIHCPLNCLSSFVKDKLIRFVGVFLSYLFQAIDIFLPILLPIPHHCR